MSRLARAGLLSSDTDTTVAEIADFVRFARAEASDQFGRTVMEKLGLLGYAVGAVEYCSRTSIKVKICFHDFLRVAGALSLLAVAPAIFMRQDREPKKAD